MATLVATSISISQPPEQNEESGELANYLLPSLLAPPNSLAGSTGYKLRVDHCLFIAVKWQLISNSLGFPFLFSHFSFLPLFRLAEHSTLHESRRLCAGRTLVGLSSDVTLPFIEDHSCSYETSACANESGELIISRAELTS